MSKHPLDTALAASISGDADESERILRSLDPNDPRVVFNLGWHEIRHGRLRQGLDMMDAGRFLSCFGSQRIPGTIWRDQDLTNKTLLLRLEGGFGDEIANFRFARDFEIRGARVVVSCSSQMRSLFSRHGFVCVDNQHVTAVQYDYWVPAMSAAHILGYDQHSISGKPYLRAEATQLWSTQGNLRVGIRWSGNPEFEHHQHRKFDPKLLIRLHELPGVTVFSLQRDENLVDGLPFADLRNQMQTWEDTASILAGLDLVITSCTSVAHCAAALGVETWIIVPVLPYYFWAVPTETSVWYDSVRLFRQTRYGDWQEPLDAVKKALYQRLEPRSMT